MACRQVSTYNGVSGSGRQGGGGYVTEADCLNACKEGACCESDGTCSVKPQCQCQGTGQTFKGVGTACAACNICSCADIPLSFSMTFSGFSYQFVSSTNNLSDLSGYGQGLTDYLQAYTLQLALARSISAPGVYARYRTYSSSPYTYADLILNCTGTISGVEFLLQSNESDWAQYQGNRQNHKLQAGGSWSGGPLPSASYPFAVCPGSRTPLELPPPKNPDSGLMLVSYAAWIQPYDIALGFGNTGYYTSAVGKVTLTATYANPLP